MTEHEDAGGLGEHRLTAARLAKVEAIREAGGDPYPPSYEPDATAAGIAASHGDLADGEESGAEVVVAGRLMGLRDMGRLAFGVLQDATGRIQLFATSGVLGDRYGAFTDLDLGDIVGARGEVVRTKKGELSVRVEEFTLLAKALRPLPEKWHGLQDVEQRYRRRYVDLIVNEEAREILRARSATVAALREAFTRRGFLEVETPVLQPIASGAMAKPFETRHLALDMDMYLRIAVELYLKRLMIGGVERVFEIAKTFRNEGVSPRHNPEFTMLEAYQAYADYYDVMDALEGVVGEVAGSVCGTTDLTYQGRPMPLGGPWRRLDYVGAVDEATGMEWDLAMPLDGARGQAARLGVEVDDAWGVGKIVSEVFEEHVEPGLWEPTIVMDFPVEISPLARRHRDDPLKTERFEVIVAGRELANAFSELNDPVDQRRRFEAQLAARAAGDDEAHPMDEDFLRALEYGMPPTGGLGIGVDRLVMLLTDQASIREVILFPAMRPEA
ncbi:MAG: lysine--tRNA ligase [Actinobacteria bacterium]|nr:lysine--tRNA ligase [Actinomycetota bacterium]